VRLISITLQFSGVIRHVKRCHNCYSGKKNEIKCAIFVPLSHRSLSEGEICVVSPKPSKFPFFGTVKDINISSEIRPMSEIFYRMYLRCY
jgi:hypothetical protein